MRRPKAVDSPVLASVLPVVGTSRRVHTDSAKAAEHAEWLACEPLPVPDFTLPFELGGGTERTIDFVLVATALNFAFTDFETREPFVVRWRGERWQDAMGLFACLARALEEGVPALEGGWMAGVDVGDLRRLFRGERPLPMLEERAAILRQVGATLEENWEGRFHRFIAESPRTAWGSWKRDESKRGGLKRDDASADRARDHDGLVARLAAEFPRFDDTASYDGHAVRFYKLAQLAVWTLYGAVPRKAFPLADPGRLTAFADYILPVALEAMGILRYEPALARRVAAGEPLPVGGPEEVEIRAHTVYATALLTEEVNRRRPDDLQVIVPQIDYRLWSHFHETFRPHHLTRTIMY